jgi:hypothetical protein
MDDEENKSQSAFDGPLATKPEDLTDKVVDDIARSEVDEVIRIEDEKLLEAISQKPSLKEKIRTWFHSWWDVPKKRNTVIGVSAAILLMTMIIPPTRYAVLNLVGFRAAVEIVVLDESTSQPLKNVDVTVQGQTSQTNVDGLASFDRLKLGSAEIKINKVAYAESVVQETLRVGGNKIEDAKLKPIGSQFSFEISDWLSGKKLDKAEVEYWESSAVSDNEGKAVLTIEPTDEEKIEVLIKAEGYREQRFAVNTLDKQTMQVQMKVGQASYFVSNRSGKFDVYKMYVGEEPEVIVAANGKEREDLRFAVSPDRKYGMLVATRDEVRNAEGFLLSGLYSVNLETSELTKIDESERIDLVGWVDNKLVYVKVASGASGNNPNRHRLQIVDPTTQNTKEVAASNYFNDVVVADNSVFYAPSDAYKDNPDASFFKADADGNITKIYDGEVWTIVQTGLNELAFDATGDWYSYSISNDSATSLDGPPGRRESKIFTANQDGTALWVDQRDGKGVLIANKADSTEDKVIWTQSGLRYPIQWLSNKHVVFRVNTNDETADYIINIEGGDAVKLTDVSNVSGTDRWFYY